MIYDWIVYEGDGYGEKGGKCSHSSIPIYPKHVGCCVPDFNSILQLKSFNDTDHN